MTRSAHRSFVRRDGLPVTAVQFDGRVPGLATLLAAFPGRVRPHPHRDDAVLVRVGEREVRVTAGEWVAAGPDGTLSTWPDDQFRATHAAAVPLAA